MPYGHKGDPVIRYGWLPGIHLPEDAWPRRGRAEPHLQLPVVDALHGVDQVGAAGKGGAGHVPIRLQQLQEVLAAVHEATDVPAVVDEAEAVDGRGPVARLGGDLDGVGGGKGGGGGGCG